MKKWKRYVLLMTVLSIFSACQLSEDNAQDLEEGNNYVTNSVEKQYEEYQPPVQKYGTNGDPLLIIQGISPVNDQYNVAVDKDIEIQFSTGVNQSNCIYGIDVMLFNSSGNLVNADLVWERDDKLIIKPHNQLSFYSEYSYVLTTNIQDTNGSPLQDTVQFTFSSMSAAQWDAKTRFNIDLDQAAPQGVGLHTQLPDSPGNEHGFWGFVWNNPYEHIWGRVEATEFTKGDKKVILWKGNYLESTYGWGAGAEIGLYRDIKLPDGSPWFEPEDATRTKMSFVLVNKHNGQIVSSTDRNWGNYREDRMHWWLQRWGGQSLESHDMILYYQVEEFWGKKWRKWEGMMDSLRPWPENPWDKKVVLDATKYTYRDTYQNEEVSKGTRWVADDQYWNGGGVDRYGHTIKSEWRYVRHQHEGLVWDKTGYGILRYDWFPHEHWCWQSGSWRVDDYRNDGGLQYYAWHENWVYNCGETGEPHKHLGPVYGDIYGWVMKPYDTEEQCHPVLYHEIWNFWDDYK